MITGKVIPFLLPLAFEGSLNLKQFQSYMSVVKVCVCFNFYYKVVLLSDKKLL